MMRDTEGRGAYDGVSDMYCMGDAYLAEELRQEYAEKTAKEDRFKIIQRRTKNGKFEIKEINTGSCE